MTFRAHALSFLDTALRVPPLFVMDEVLKCCFGFSRAIHVSYANILSDQNPFLNDEGFGELDTEDMKAWQVENDTASLLEAVDEGGGEGGDESMFSSFAPAIAKVLMFKLVYTAATITFLLSSQRLIKVYLVVASIAVILTGYQGNMAVVRHLTSPPQSTKPPVLMSALSLNTTALWDSGGTLSALTVNYVLQSSLGYLFTALCSGPQHPFLHKLIIVSFLLPTLSMLLSLPSQVLSTVPVAAALLPLAVVKYTVATNLLKCFQVVVEGYQYARRVMRDFGLHSLLESEWVRLNVPNVLRTFWMIRVAHHLVTLLGEFMYVHGEYQSLWALDMPAVYVIFKAVMTQGCETAVALLGMTSIVSYVSHYVGVVFQMILLTVEDDERSMGTVCAILFFILAEQSGLTVMEGEKRFIRLCRNFCLLFTAMLHFIHNMVNPVLMSLSASRNPALYRHVRALVVCSMLIFFPVVLLFVLWSFYPLSTWLLAVSAFSIQVIVKTLVSLLIYALFLVDAYRSTFWEKLDDYVYYIRAFGNSVEFVFGILLFFNGAWIYVFESGGSIRAFMMCIHAYFNIWCEARNGWTVFMKRRTAVNKINSLPEATQEQLENHDDVCAICFQGLHSAKITKCNHYFHSVCLRKWLYVQDSCPLCHETLYRTEEKDGLRGEGEGEGNQRGNEETERAPEQDIRGHQRDENVDTEELPVWGEREIDVILGENMNGGNREVVIDNEVGEAVISLPVARPCQNQQEGENNQNLQNPEEDREVVQEEEGIGRVNNPNENNQIFVIRSRRSPVVDQDIGQQ
ncbi:protein TRC8 homolog [Penaeus vannamei]|uniref:protein TRC8 homolog n=1 Tax=Penaeus vannamei TaxID=6689 RepID=UPI00387FA3C2